uniref:Uncharacterized protein n=1 Tax=Anguilla anguilla TaxID=7936 RepID=A0A0E9SP98_ANGAN
MILIGPDGFYVRLLDTCRSF